MLQRIASLLICVVLAACSTAPPSTSPQSTTASSSSGPGTSLGVATFSPAPLVDASPGASTEPSPSLAPVETVPPSVAPTEAATGWTTVLPPLTQPKAYLDVAFASNGDVLVVGTDELGKSPATVWIARYDPAGNLKKKVTVAKRLQAFLGRSMVHIDLRDDSILFTQVDFSTGLYGFTRVSSATGKVIEQHDLHRAMTTIALTSNGKIFGISATYGTYTNRRRCVLDRVAADGRLASGVDYWLKECETIAHPTPPAYFSDPMSIDVGMDGNLLMLDWGKAGSRYHDEPAGLGVSVITPGFEFVRHFHLPKAWQLDDFYLGIPAQGTYLAADSTGRVYVDAAVMSADMTERLGFHLGVFDKAGKLLATYGYGGETADLKGPCAVRVDQDDRVWVVDFDEASKSFTVKRLA